MRNTFGNNIKITIFGASHAPDIGVSIEGLPSGFAIDMDELRAFLKRRAPGQGAHTTARKEPDEAEFIEGLTDGKTGDTPLKVIIRNTDIKPTDYNSIRDIPRPSHADYTAFVKYGEKHDVSGGGAFSGRMTAPMCIAGGICLQLLARENIQVAAHITQIGNIRAPEFDPVHPTLPVLGTKVNDDMLAAIEEARQEGDSLGGIIECAVVGIPAGVGEPMFDGVENHLSAIIFGIPAVKGIEFGNGFAAASLRGSENNDAFIIKDGNVQTRTNNHGGILGGITSGMPIIFRVAIKPTPSITIEQDSVCLSKMEAAKLSITGRHDPCIVPRAVPCIEAAAAIAIYDLMRK
ncbi:MAG: chorismate synthase [Oscillospiraceae bacterium]|nr:chorismate synthase [Oscillospiraceae bacterium]